MNIRWEDSTVIMDGRRVGLGSDSSSDIIIVTVVVLLLLSFRSLLLSSLAIIVTISASMTRTSRIIRLMS